jgi:hypothetical protein
MKTATLDKLIWVFTYGGLIAIALGISVQRSDDAVGWVLMAAGAVVGLVGIVLLVVRARIKDTPT